MIHFKKCKVTFNEFINLSLAKNYHIAKILNNKNENEFIIEMIMIDISIKN